MLDSQAHELTQHELPGILSILPGHSAKTGGSTPVLNSLFSFLILNSLSQCDKESESMSLINIGFLSSNVQIQGHLMQSRKMIDVFICSLLPTIDSIDSVILIIQVFLAFVHYYLNLDREP